MFKSRCSEKLLQQSEGTCSKAFWVSYEKESRQTVLTLEKAASDQGLHSLHYFHVSRSTTKSTIWPVRPSNTQISQGIRPVWSVLVVHSWEDLKLYVLRKNKILLIWNSQNCSMFPLAFVAGSLQGHWWGFISRNYVVWPIFFLMNVFIALKGTHFWILFHLLYYITYKLMLELEWCKAKELPVVYGKYMSVGS